MMNRYTKRQIQQMSDAYKPFADERGLMSGMIEQLLADHDKLCNALDRAISIVKLSPHRISLIENEQKLLEEIRNDSL